MLKTKNGRRLGGPHGAHHDPNPHRARVGRMEQQLALWVPHAELSQGSGLRTHSACRRDIPLVPRVPQSREMKSKVGSQCESRKKRREPISLGN